MVFKGVKMKISINLTSFAGMLTILFIGLKLTNVITWSWLWILSPLWISLLITISILLLIFAIYLFSRKKRKN